MMHTPKHSHSNSHAHTLRYSHFFCLIFSSYFILSFSFWLRFFSLSSFSWHTDTVLDRSFFSFVFLFVCREWRAQNSKNYVKIFRSLFNSQIGLPHLITLQWSIPWLLVCWMKHSMWLEFFFPLSSSLCDILNILPSDKNDISAS